MNAISLLTQDHQNVKNLFRDFEIAGDDGARRKEEVANKIFSELEVHSTIEEERFYPALEQAADEKGKGLVREAIEEHSMVKDLITELKAMSPEAEEYDAKFSVLSENVEHHIEEEEGELFPRARQTLGTEKLNSLGSEMAARKEALSATRPGVFQQAKALVTKAFDALAGTETPKSHPRRRTSTRAGAKTLARRTTRRRKSNRASKTAAQRKRVRPARGIVQKPKAKKATSQPRSRRAARRAPRPSSRRHA